MDETKANDYITQLMCFSYLCSSESDVTNRLKYTNKILLPESVLFALKEDIEDLEFPLFFKVSNTETKFGHVCGVEEFSAPPGVCHIPYQVMADISVKEGNTVNIELICPPKGNYVKFRFHTSEFSKLENPKVILEKIISSDYPVITQGQTIILNYQDLGKIYHIDVLETKPTEVIQIINTNLNVDFDKPFDYKESEDNPPCPSNNLPFPDVSENFKIFRPHANGFIPFSGKGFRLGTS